MNRVSYNLHHILQHPELGGQPEGLHSTAADLLELPEQGLKHHWLPGDKRSATENCSGRRKLIMKSEKEKSDGV